MFKELQSSLTGLFGANMVPIVLALIAVAALLMYSSSKGGILDQMTDGVYSPNVAPSPPVTSMSASVDADAGKAPLAYSSGGDNLMREVASPSDLLPKDSNSQWAALNPINQGNINMPDLLQAGYHIGLDTIGQTMKNPNLQLRSDPIIEKKSVGPWNNSTTEADYARVPLELGYGGR